MSDPDKRKTYDKHGVEGLKVKEAMENMDPTILLEAFVESGLGTRVAMVCAILCCCGILMMFPIFLILKVDAAIAWGWPAVFAPLFACSGVSVLCAFFAAVQAEQPSSGDGDGDSGRLRSVLDRVLVVASPALVLTFLAVLSVYLDKGGIAFGVVCIPAFLMEALGLVRMPTELSAEYFRAQGGLAARCWLAALLPCCPTALRHPRCAARVH